MNGLSVQRGIFQAITLCLSYIAKYAEIYLLSAFLLIVNLVSVCIVKKKKTWSTSKHFRSLNAKLTLP